MTRTAGKGNAPAIALVIALSACGPKAGAPGEWRPSAALADRDCPRSIAERAPDTLRVGLLAVVDPEHAPEPTNRAEAIVFRHLYGTLVRLDCRGRVHPELAESWTAEDGMRRWTFVLREDAHFWDGAPVTADDVRGSWVAYGMADRLARDAGLPRDSVRARGARTLVLSFTEPRPDALVWLAHPGAGVARPQAASHWPLGTGVYRIVRAREATGRRPAMLELAGIRDGGDPASPGRLEILLQPGGDGRDLLDRGLDVLIAEDPAALEYAASHPAYRTLPLPWDRTHVLVVPGARASTGGAGRSGARGAPSDSALPHPALPPAFVEALTRDVVPADTRPISEAEGWAASGACRARDSGAPFVGRPRVRRAGVRPDADEVGPDEVVLYRTGDAIGRAIAERLVALAAVPGGARPALDDSARAALRRLFPGGGPAHARAASRRELEASLADGEAVAYVLSVAAHPIWPCERGVWPGRRGVYPIIETRAHAILRQGAADLRIDADGTPVLGAAAREGG